MIALDIILMTLIWIINVLILVVIGFSIVLKEIRKIEELIRNINVYTSIQDLREKLKEGI